MPKDIAALLAFLFGGFGVHRFYMGQWWGIFYLLFFWLWIPGIIAFIEMIVFLCSNQENWDAKYNEGRPKGPNDGSSAAVIIIAVIGGAFILIALIGILAAVALPAYQDYTTRATVAETMADASHAKKLVQDFYQANDQLPDSNIMLGLEEPYTLNTHSELEVSTAGAITIEFNEPTSIEGSTIVLTPQFDNTYGEFWSCTEGDMDNRYRPANCRK
ncbi:pilin [Teredinibacter haidensis]|uniref:pilin n=1 Tax=Teredinibacter haidensis TaxID=2731755 RepID=UPI001C8EBE53|nr:pilin [Teredinibacter haidensis]